MVLLISNMAWVSPGTDPAAGLYTPLKQIHASSNTWVGGCSWCNPTLLRAHVIKTCNFATDYWFV
ncbi:hypothetical protein C2S51_037679 [Perilla frutescens var. frutescens]|nr:hypothetical protein C2S51_037679 [Perilla frutescens var. frutescens]